MCTRPDGCGAVSRPPLEAPVDPFTTPRRGPRPWRASTMNRVAGRIRSHLLTRQLDRSPVECADRVPAPRTIVLCDDPHRTDREPPTMSSVRSVPRRLVAATLGLTLLALLPAAPVGAHGKSDNPEYFVRVVPSAVAAGTTTTSTVRIKQLVNAHHAYAVIGSMRITPPAGFVITAASARMGTRTLPVTVAGNAVTAENLDLRTRGQRLTFSITSEVRCGTIGATTWRVQAHEARDFENTSRRIHIRKSPKSALGTSVAGCSLDFLRQPTLAGRNTVISSVSADPSGASVAVRLIAGNGQPALQSGIPVGIAIKPGTGAAGASLGGTRDASTNANGVATFAPTIDTAGTGYRLLADGTGMAGATSAPFNVAGVAVACTGSCTGEQSKGSTTASISSTTTGTLSLTLGLDDVSCDNAINKYYQASSEPLLFDVTDGTGRTVVTVRIDAADVDRRLGRYRVCFSSPVSTFINKYGHTIAPGEAGILPDCWDDDDDDHHHDATSIVIAHDDDDEPRPPLPLDHQACLEKRWKDRAGNVYVRFSVPPGDPRAKI